MIGELVAYTCKDPSRYGILGTSAWASIECETSNLLLVVFYFYFCDVEGLHRFVNDGLNREAWHWLKAGPGDKHMSVYHKTFYAPARGCGNIYGPRAGASGERERET